MVIETENETFSANISYEAKLALSETHYIAFAASLPIMILNGAVLTILIINRHAKDLQKLNFQLSTLCLCDIFAGVTLFLHKFPSLEPHNTKKLSCSVFVILLFVSHIVSITNMTGIAVRRYISLRTFNSLTDSQGKVPRYVLLLATLLIGSICTGMFAYFVPKDVSRKRELCTIPSSFGQNKKQASIIMISVSSSLLLLANVLSCLSIRKLRKNCIVHEKETVCSQKFVELENAFTQGTQSTSVYTLPSINDKSKPTKTIDAQRNKMIAKAVKSYCYALLCSNISIFTAASMSMLLVVLKVSTHRIYDVLIMIAFSNSIFNPIIYVVKLKQFRNLLWRRKI